jgi:hypothetical protein
MKPNHEVELAKRLSRDDSPSRRGDSFPRIGFAFQAPRGGDFHYGGGRPNRPRGFTQLAREVFRRDARRSFAVETIVLGTITLATAWQIADMLREVFVVLKNGGIY